MDLSPDAQSILEATFYDAAQVMSPSGIKVYIEGAKRLTDLNRGNDVVITYLQEIPLAIKECDEDIIADAISAATKLTSLSSAKVASTMLSSLPTAAHLLGNTKLVRDYLKLLQKIANKSSRALQPMFNHIEELLSKLTLDGLDHWANFGIQAYRRDYSSLTKYFNLESQDSIATLQKLRRGVLFVDTKRKLSFYLRALWGQDFSLLPNSSEGNNFTPYIENNTLHLPDAVDANDNITGHKIYRATAAHLASHHCYTKPIILTEQKSPIHKFFIGFIEDARIEYKAISNFPGLKNLWGELLTAETREYSDHHSLEELKQLACMLLDNKIKSKHNFLNNFAKQFHKEIEAEQDNNQFSRRMGLMLFDNFISRDTIPNIQALERMHNTYRDDNRFLWSNIEFKFCGIDSDTPSTMQKQKHINDSEIGVTTEVDSKPSKDDKLKKGTNSIASLPGDSQERNYSTKPISNSYHYQEWDYQINLYRPDWVTVNESQLPNGNPKDIEKILFEHRTQAHRIKQVIDLLSAEGVQRKRNMEDGDEVDINAAIDAMISIRKGEQPDTRITMDNVLKTRDLSVVILLDLSESTNERVHGSEKTVLELTRESSILVATAIDGIGDPFAIHGFSSDGRHDVRYYRFKDFNQEYGDIAKSHLAGMQGGLSTRMGAAMRHASHYLLKQPERRKLLLIVTDGEPADIDERDPQHLRHDTKKAVEELKSKGILSYCLTLDPIADNYVKWIFGANNYTVLDKIDKLPEKLPVLFASLTS